MNERPEVYTIKKSENDGLTLERRSFRSLGVAAGLILALGITGLTLSGCSDSDDEGTATTSGGTTTYSGGSTTTTTSYTDKKTLPCNSQPIPAGYTCTCNCI